MTSSCFFLKIWNFDFDSCVCEREREGEKKRGPKKNERKRKTLFFSLPYPGRRQPLAPRAPRREKVDHHDRVGLHQRLEVRCVDRRGIVYLRRVEGARRVVGDPFPRPRARMPSVVMGVKACALAVVAQGQLPDSFGEVEPLCPQGVGDVERRKLARQRRERHVEVDSEELSGGRTVDDELLLVGRGEEAVELLRSCVCVGGVFLEGERERERVRECWSGLRNSKRGRASTIEEMSMPLLLSSLSFLFFSFSQIK